jgi:hypothetical protein
MMLRKTLEPWTRVAGRALLAGGLAVAGQEPLAAQSLPQKHPAQVRHDAALEAPRRARAAEVGARAFEDLARRGAPPLYWHPAEEWLPILGREALGAAWRPEGEWLFGLESQCTPGWWGRAQVGVGAQGPLPANPADRTVELRLYPRKEAVVPEVPVTLQVVIAGAEGTERVVRTETIQPAAWCRPGFTLYVERSEVQQATAWYLQVSGEPRARVALPLPRLGADWESRWEALLATSTEWSAPARRLIDELHLWRERGAQPPHGTSPERMLSALEAEARGARPLGAPWPLGVPERGPWLLEVGDSAPPRGALIWVTAADGAPDEVFAGALGERLAAWSERSGWAVLAVSGAGLADVGNWFSERGLGREFTALCVPRGAALLPVQLWRAQLPESAPRVHVACEVRRAPAPPWSEGVPRLWAPDLERPEGDFEAEAGVLPCFSDYEWMGPIEAWCAARNAESESGSPR